MLKHSLSTLFVTLLSPIVVGDGAVNSQTKTDPKNTSIENIHQLVVQILGFQDHAAEVSTTAFILTVSHVNNNKNGATHEDVTNAAMAIASIVSRQ